MTRVSVAAAPLVLAVLLSASVAIPSAQNAASSPELPVLVRQLLDATADKERAAIIEAAPTDALTLALRIVLNERGVAFRRGGDLDKAANAFLAAKAVAERIGDRRGVANSLINY